MTDHPLDLLKQLCISIKNKIHKSLHWSWDFRFSVPLMVFTEGQSKEVYSIIKGNFAENWTVESADKAPEIIKQLVGQMFGVRHGQLLMTMDRNSDVILFAAWWPWDDGENISLRIGMRSVTDSKFSQEELDSLLKQWLNISES